MGFEPSPWRRDAPHSRRCCNRLALNSFMRQLINLARPARLLSSPCLRASPKKGATASLHEIAEARAPLRIDPGAALDDLGARSEACIQKLMYSAIRSGICARARHAQSSISTTAIRKNLPTFLPPKTKKMNGAFQDSNLGPLAEFGQNLGRILAEFSQNFSLLFFH